MPKPYQIKKREARRKGRRCEMCNCLIEDLHALRRRCDTCQLKWRAARTRVLRKKKPELFAGYEQKRKSHRREKDRERYQNDPEYRAKKIERACRRVYKRLSDLRQQLAERDGFICALCGQFLPTHMTGQNVHVDHIKPLAKGGQDEVENMRVVHARCNLVRGDGRGKEVF